LRKSWWPTPISTPTLAAPQIVALSDLHIAKSRIAGILIIGLQSFVSMVSSVPQAVSVFTAMAGYRNHLLVILEFSIV